MRGKKNKVALQLFVKVMLLRLCTARMHVVGMVHGAAAKSLGS